MVAALHASDVAVSFLLSLGANPDKTADNGRTALMDAIRSKCITTTNLLAPVTKVKLGGALYELARQQVDVTKGELRQLMERAAQDKEAAMEAFEGATKFGSTEIIRIIAEKMSDHQVSESNKEELWMDARAR